MSEVKPHVRSGTCRSCGRDLVQVTGDGPDLVTYHPAVSLPLKGERCPALLRIGGTPEFSFNVHPDQFIAQPAQRPASNSEGRKRSTPPDPSDPAAFLWPPAVSTAIWAEVIREACAKAWDEGNRSVLTEPNPYRTGDRQ